MKKLQNLVLAALTVLAVVPAQAGTSVKVEAAGIQYEVPDGWKSGPDGENKDATRVENADEDIAFVIHVSDADNVQAAAEKVAAEVDEYLEGVKVESQAKEGEHNGMKTLSFSGTGTDEGTTWNWDITIFMAKKPVVVLSWVTPETAKNPPADMMAFVQSLKPM